ncbi:SdpI family protein [Caloramator sp. E03]|uniref:SdpI family protein n=1 Tax=Caloramator sp. E03 TaxID=2576307 RepID=UPI00143DC79A|nr:SdpI family protein [Caloramator sp. E03]
MKKIIKKLKKDWPIISLMTLTLLISIILYPKLPDRIPRHWNIKGEVDAYSGKLSGILSLNLMNIGFYFLFLILPNLDPKKENYEKFEPAYNIIRYTFHFFFITLQLITIFYSLGYKINIGSIVTLSVGIMFMLLGNQMGRIKHNYFVGIRTPWTLANEAVWTKTHRLSAPLWVAGGFIIAVLGFFSNNIAFVGIIIITIIISAIPIVYSYNLYKKIMK